MRFRSAASLRAAYLATACLWPAAGMAQSLDLSGETLDLAVRAIATKPEAPTIGGEALLKGRFSSLQTMLKLGVETGEKADQVRSVWTPSLVEPRSGRWTSGTLGLGADWAPIPLAKIELSANAQVRTDSDMTSPVWLSAYDQRVRTGRSSARVTASINPLPNVSLSLGGQTSGGDLHKDTASAEASLLQDQSQQMFMTTQWAPVSRLKLEGGVKMESMGVYWKSQGSRTASYSYLEPRLGGSLAAFDGTTLSFFAEGAVSPINTDQFVSFAQAAEDAAAAEFRPGREWRYQLGLQQRLLSDVELRATLTQARLQSVTDLGPVGSAQAPIAIGSGERRQIEAAIAAPLRMSGLPDLSVRLKGSWRDSQVEDPFTGDPRRLSGEIPYDAELTLGPAASGLGLSWGVAARARGPTSVYEMSQITTRGASAGLGGFVTYNPGPVSIRLQLDNVIGGRLTESNALFDGPRQFNNLGARTETRSLDRAVRLQLSRPL
jgi:hypothetical protein